MSFSTSIRAFGLTLAVSSLTTGAIAGAPSNCDKIAQDVRESVTKEPTKVLMIVEDALVINETCACEIVRAAITASNADQPMVKQIVQTAVAVAPKMTPVIMECANSVSPGAVEGSGEAQTVSAKSGKSAKSVVPSEAIQPPKDKGTDFSQSFTGIRGVYLMAPAVGGFLPIEEDEPKTETPKRRSDKPHHPRRKIVQEPLSPSMAGWAP